MKRGRTSLAKKASAQGNGIAPLTIVIDTREQRPLDFGGEVPVVRGTLKTGDYGLAGLEDRFAVERKSIDDLFGTIVADRPRFLRELDRSRSLDLFVILIEASAGEVLAYTSPESTGISDAVRSARPRIVMNFLMHALVKYRAVPIFAGSDRAVCAATVLSIAEYFLAERGSLPKGEPSDPLAVLDALGSAGAPGAAA
jgi:ERCC4-type nuclease